MDSPPFSALPSLTPPPFLLRCFSHESNSHTPPWGCPSPNTISGPCTGLDVTCYLGTLNGARPPHHLHAVAFPSRSYVATTRLRTSPLVIRTHSLLLSGRLDAPATRGAEGATCSHPHPPSANITSPSISTTTTAIPRGHRLKINRKGFINTSPQGTGLVRHPDDIS
ncbi:uncharacterized protein EI97DRAFT_303675 [Westerdykella ornata]|uniref:Uncharacterized protein n=1 Tax=Westerdykella ornata TaxID=318751 RepID=A0A6A6JMQ0_WESOR|nr:uncharacterized protein EI97DRAFT_303675 [Westerdykella ornata]KAF2276936.1 hypothetical protein EI97DRAFT_303675 [Westerdykella ornata]